jgi:hypothetical protein
MKRRHMKRRHMKRRHQRRGRELRISCWLKCTNGALIVVRWFILKPCFADIVPGIRRFSTEDEL